MYVFLLFLVVSIVSGLKYEAIDFGIDYFLYRNVKLICVLDCASGSVGNVAFTKKANAHNMLVTIVDIDASNKPSSGVEKCLEYKMFSVGVVLAAACDASQQTLLLASRNMIFDQKHAWLIIEENNINNDTTPETNATFTIDYLECLNISVDADIIQATKTAQQEYIMHEVYNFGKVQGGDIIVNLVGTWNVQSGLNLDFDLNSYKYYRRWNFQQWQMRMIFVISPLPKDLDPRVLTDTKGTPGVTTFLRTSAMILHEIADIHNFGFKYTASDRWIGTYEINSSRVVANSLHFREQDVTPVLRYLTGLSDKVDLVYPSLTSLETRYYYRIPTIGPGKFENQFLRPLSKGAWLCVLAISVMCGLLLLVSAAFERRTSSAQYAVFSVTALICQQFFEDIDDSFTSTTRSTAARKLTVLVTGLSCLLIYNYYTSSVVSWLLSGPPPSITSLQELLESPLELLFEDTGYTRSWLQVPNYYYNRRNAKIEDELRRKKVYKRGYSLPPLVPLEKGIALVKAGGYAYHTETNLANEIIARTFTQIELCELGSLQSMEKTRLFPGLQYRSPYKEFLGWSGLRLTERGVVSCIQQRTDSPSVECEGSSPRALALGGAAPAFILLALGYGLATIIMIVERCIHRRSSTYLKNKIQFK